MNRRKYLKSALVAVGPTLVSVRLGLALIVVAASSSLATAADRHWNGSGTGGNTGTWQRAGRWTPNQVPTITDIAIFNTVGLNTGQTVALDRTRNGELDGTVAKPFIPAVAAGLKFQATGTITLNPAHLSNDTLTIGGNGITVNPESNGTINARVVLSGGAQTWANNSGHNLNLTQNIRTGGQHVDLYIDGDGGAAHAGLINISGILGGDGAVANANIRVIKRGLVTLDLSDLNTFTGGLTVEQGVVVIRRDENLGPASPLLNGGTLRTASDSLTYTRWMALGAGGGTIDTAGNSPTFSGRFLGSGPLTKTGGGTLVLTGTNNDYSGDLTLSAGTLRLENTTALNSRIFNNTQIVFQLDHNNSGIGTYDGAISGLGSVIKNGAGELTLPGINSYIGGTTINDGTLTVGPPVDGNSSLGSGAVAFNAGTIKMSAPMTLANPIVLKGPAVHRFDTNGSDSILSGGVSDEPGAGEFRKVGAGKLILTGPGDWSGGTRITGGLLQGNTGNLNRDFTVDTGTGIVFDEQNTQFTATYGSGGGVIRGGGSLTKIGPGTLKLVGVQEYRGGTFVNEGKLSVDIDARLGDLTGPLYLNGGTLQITGIEHFARDIILGPLGGTIENASHPYLDGDISGVGSLTKTGLGTLSLRGNNTYMGKTFITEGKLRVSGTHTGGDAYIISPGAALTGNGTITAPVQIRGSLNPDSDTAGVIGHIAVGSYDQTVLPGQLSGLLEIDILPGDSDTVQVSSNAQLGGTLLANATALPNPVPGMSITILTASSLMGTTFDRVETIGTTEGYFAPTYLPGEVRLDFYEPGDMDRRDGVDPKDIGMFALALTNIAEYEKLVPGGVSPNEICCDSDRTRLDFDDIDDFAAILEMHNIPHAMAAIERALLGVPEPSAVVLFLVGVSGCYGAGVRRRR